MSIDETSSKKGHNYLTILSDAKEKKVVGIGVGKNKEAVVAGIQEMESRGSKASKVKEVAIDLSPAYTSAVLEHFEKASLVYDRFHVEQLNHWERTPLIILDDFGLQPLDQQIRLALLQLVEDRYARKSIIITSQLPVSKWHEFINEPTLADAILDRLTAKAHRI